ncbi:hypothetical protein YC2023_002173 [Brassica napus]
MTPPVPPPPLPPEPVPPCAPLLPSPSSSSPPAPSSSSPPAPSSSSPPAPSENAIPGVASKMVDSQPSSSASQGSQPTSKATTSKEAFNWAKNLDSAARFPVANAPVSTSAEGRPRVRISNGVFERGAKIHSDYIVGIFYGKAPSYGKIWGVLNYLWGKDRRVTINHLSKNAYLFYIPSPVLRNRILQHELWRVGDSPFFVTKWKSEFCTNPPSLDKAPVWATINNVPFDLITPEGLSNVCVPLGKVVDSKPFTSISSAEVKVIVDLTKPLPAEIELECEDGSILLLNVIYPWLPPLCSLCGERGHKESLCPAAPHRAKNQDKHRPSSKKSQKPNSPAPNQEWRQIPPSSKSVAVPQEQIFKEIQKDIQEKGLETSSSIQKDLDPVTPSVPAQPVVVLASDKLATDSSSLVISESMEISPDADGFIKVSPRSAQRSMVVANKTPVTTSNNFELLQVHTSDQETTEGNKIVLSTEFSPSSSASVTRKQKKRKLRNSPVSGGILSLGWKDDHSNN